MTCPFLLSRTCQCTQTTTRCSTSEMTNPVLPRSLEKQRALPLTGTTTIFFAGNLKKYQTMNIGYSEDKNDTTYTIYVNNEEMKTVGKLELLGVILDLKLNFTDHISSMCKKASQRIGVLMQLRNLIPLNTKLVLFKTAILPYLTYCQLVWHYCKTSDSRMIERLQDHHANYSELLKRAELPTLSNTRLQDVCTLMYKVKHKLCPAYISNIFNTHSTYYFLRQTDFSIPRYNTVTYGEHSLRYLGPKLWENCL